MVLGILLGILNNLDYNTVHIDITILNHMGYVFVGFGSVFIHNLL